MKINMKELINFMIEDEIKEIQLVPFFGYNIDYNNITEINKLKNEREFIQKYYNKTINLNTNSEEFNYFLKNGFKFHKAFKIIKIKNDEYTIIKNTLFYKIFKKIKCYFKKINTYIFK